MSGTPNDASEPNKGDGDKSKKNKKGKGKGKKNAAEAESTQNNAEAKTAANGASGASAKSEPKPEKPAKDEDTGSTDRKDGDAVALPTKKGKHAATPVSNTEAILFGWDKALKKKDDGEKKEHPFWKLQPVPGLDEKVTGDSGPIESKTLQDVKAEPYNLPAAYQWESVDMTDEKQVDEVYTLLTNHYVEDDDAQFRFDYSKPFLAWALRPPGYRKDWHVAVREKAGKKRMMGFITGIPVEIRIYDKILKVAEINFLCVHKSLRNKRLAPVLIMEITRRVNLVDMWQAVYTAGVVIPKPVAKNRYWHRSLNPRKLIDIQFSRLAPRMTMTMTIKLYQLPAEPLTKGIRALEKKDIPEATTLLRNHLRKFKLEEFEHWFTPRDGIMNCYVVEGSDGKLTDMCSFYTLNSTVIKNEKHPLLKAAYSFYNVSTKTPMVDLMKDLLIFARKCGYDVFNALDVMDNESFFKDLKFGIGDGHLQYYLYNWRCPEMAAKEVGLVLM